MVEPSEVAPIEVALGFDANYAPHGAAAIASAVRRTPGARFRFTILYDNVDEATRRGIELAAPGMAFHWVEVRDEDLPPMAARGYFSRANLFRLGVERLAPADCTRMIYLDADAIVCRDLRALWAIDLQGRPLGAVGDTFTMPEAFARKLGLPEPKIGYFNAGVLLIDLELVRRERIFERAIEMLRDRMDEFPFLDQDVLNVLCWERWTKIPNYWNTQRLMSKPDWDADLRANLRLNGAAPGIIHYTDWAKPWLREAYHPWAWAYWDNLARTPFLDQIAKKHGVDGKQRLRLRLRSLWHRFAPRPLSATPPMRAVLVQPKVGQA